MSDLAASARRRPGIRTAAGWTALVVAAGVVGGVLPAVAAVVLAAWHLLRPPSPRLVIGLAVAALAFVPVTWLLGNADRLGLASPLVVLDNRAPSSLAVVALLLLVVGVHRDTRREPAGTGEGDR